MSSGKILFSLSRQYPKLFTLSVVLGFSGAVFNGIGTTLIIPVLLGFLGQPMTMKGAPPLLQGLLAPFQQGIGEYNLALMTGAILALILLKNLANYANSLVSGALKRSLSSGLQEQGLRLLLEVDVDFFVKNGIGNIVNNLNNEIYRAGRAVATIAKAISVSITTLVFGGMLLWTSWQITIVSTALMAIVVLMNQMTVGRSKIYGMQLSAISKQYSTIFLDMLGGMRLVRSSAAEDFEYDRISQLIRSREQADFKSQANSALIEPVSEMTGMVALVCIVLVGRAFLGGEVEALTTVLLVYLFILFRTLPLITQLNSARNQLANLSSSLEIVHDFLRRDRKPFMSKGSIPYTSLQEGIHFNHISLSYPGHEKVVLNDVDLYLPRNTTLALVGSSGAGKSTMADLLPRFYDPTQGCILVDGVDLRELDARSLRRSMGIVSQDTFLFNTSVRNNIAYGCPNATDTEIFEAAKRANAYEFITQLPNGWETQLGDRGVLLSGGQRQRIAIARALLQDPEILILDEATSALDTVSERLVQEAIDRLSRDRTTLVIAHRLSTVQKADQIAVLDRGRVVELGSHEELLAKKGYYADLCKMQLAAKTDPDRTPTKTAQSELAHTSYEIRNRLNRLVGSLSLMMDDTFDTPNEQREWTEEAYYSALNLVKSLEMVEGDVKTKVS
ncbi:MAG: ABC transporter ATP-binding protein/permease [Timaviella obliquedivisa GSE-PSE-MK23-08B]|jgi:ABC-type multidrug transport system fused ATPase/permease subunit|nr:ABC transporter ATP-binding protein/permease [Timaviella obliquedivisa GSE-PSE-MK23-08B]